MVPLLCVYWQTIIYRHITRRNSLGLYYTRNKRGYVIKSIFCFIWWELWPVYSPYLFSAKESFGFSQIGTLFGSKTVKYGSSLRVSLSSNSIIFRSKEGKYLLYLQSFWFSWLYSDLFLRTEKFWSCGNKRTWKKKISAVTDVALHKN